MEKGIMRHRLHRQRTIRQRTFRLLAVTAGILALAGGVAYATIPNSTTAVISGCYGKTTGLLRVIDAQAGKTCTSLEVPISWNQQGPSGIAGEPGAPGQDGEDGAPGVDGKDGVPGDPFSGNFVSPNGLYSITVNDTGILLKSPSASVELKGGSLDIKNANLISVSGGALSLSGSPVTVGTCPSPLPVARFGDPVVANNSGAIVGGSGTFLSC